MMSPEDAAAALGIEADSSADEVQSAYKRRARESHPDRFAGASVDVATRASADFIRVTEARRVLLDANATRARPSGSVSGSARVVMVPTRPRWTLIVTWACVASAAVFIAVFDASSKSGVVEPLIRYAVLVGSLVVFAITGRTVWFAVAVVAFVATAVLTILFTTFGNLFGLFVLCAPAVGLMLLGRQVGKPRAMHVRSAES